MNPRRYRILFVLTLLLAMNISVIQVTGDVRADLLDPSAIIQRFPIYIEGDANLTVANGVVAGNGTPENPYIIENWTIEAAGYAGIQIRNVTSHFIIRNCVISNGSITNSSGIFLYLVVNGQIRNNLLVNDRHGIEMAGADRNIISNNTIQNMMRHGLEMVYSHYNLIENNTIDGAMRGANLANSGGSWFVNNTVTGCSLVRADYKTNPAAFELYKSRSNLFYRNDIHGNNMTAITLDYDSNYNMVLENDIHDNARDGIWEWLARENEIIANDIHHNKGTGIVTTENSYYSIINENRVHNNTRGIYIEDSDYFTMWNNTMVDNRYNFGIGEAFFSSADAIAPNNTVDGKPVRIMYKEGDTVPPADAGFLGLFNCWNITIDGVSMSDNIQSIFLQKSSNITVRNSTFSENENGIHSYQSWGILHDNLLYGNYNGIALGRETKNMIIRDNTFEQNERGVYVYWMSEGNKVHDNKFHNNTGYGIMTVSGSNVYSHNTFYGNQKGGINLARSYRETVHSNDIFDNPVGIRMYENVNYTYGTRSVVYNNSIHGNSIGIFGDAFRRTIDGRDVIHNNSIFDNGVGIKYINAHNNRILDNNISGNHEAGVVLENSGGNRIDDNDILDSGTGIVIANTSWSKNGTILNNMIRDNPVCGMDVLNVTKYTVYNNYFSNDIDQQMVHTSFRWNITRTELFGNDTNIVGGKYLGGNYWASYTGKDLDGDLIGDTDIPYGPGDELPLVPALPLLFDNTTGTPAIGENFTFNVSATDKCGIMGVFLEYWVNDEVEAQHRNITMGLTGGDTRSGNYSIELVVPRNASVLHYLMTGNNVHDLWGSTPVRHLDVLDEHKPIIDDISGVPTTGDNYRFAFNITENVGISNATVEYRFEFGGWETVELDNSSVMVLVPPGAHLLHYKVTVVDLSNNIAVHEDERPVVDNDPPVIEVICDLPATGRQFLFEWTVADNWNVTNVDINYWFDGDDQGIQTRLMVVTEGLYEFDILVPLNATVLHYSLMARDDSGNIGLVNDSMRVLDEIPPMVIDISGRPTTGDAFEISAILLDNIAVNFSFLEYRFDDGLMNKVKFEGHSTISVRSAARMLNYTIKCYDTSDNVVMVSREVNVTDNDAPTVLDLSRTRAKAGETFRFEVEADDNIGVDTVYVEYWYVGKSTRLNLTFEGGRYVGEIALSKTDTRLHYVVHVMDMEGNAMDSNTKSVELDAYGTEVEVALWPIILAVLFIIGLFVIIYYYRRAAGTTQGTPEETLDTEEEDEAYIIEEE